MVWIIIFAVFQYYVCWMTYIKWFNNEITYCNIKNSYSIWAMLLFLPLFVWIPIVPIIVIIKVTNYKYLTATIKPLLDKDKNAQ